MKKYQLTIEGMSCHHCVMAVEKELKKLSTVNIKEVKIGSAVVEADESAATKENLTKAVEEAGYTLVSAQ
ncbi:MAG: cation transporter [Bacteroidota bacterium]|nr:cation transporter [Bacteroidota bacterium]